MIHINHLTRPLRWSPERGWYKSWSHSKAYQYEYCVDMIHKRGSNLSSGWAYTWMDAWFQASITVIAILVRNTIITHRVSFGHIRVTCKKILGPQWYSDYETWYHRHTG